MILRISDLSSVLNNGLSNLEQNVMTVEDALNAYHSGTLSNEYKNISSMLLEVSMPQNDGNTYISKNLPYAFISGDLIYNIINKPLLYNGKNQFINGVSISGDVSISADNIQINGDNLKMAAKNIQLTYSNSLSIVFKNGNTEKAAVVFGYDTNNNPTVKFPCSTVDNPISGIINGALWG